MNMNERVKKNWIEIQKKNSVPVNAIGVQIKSNDKKTLEKWKAEGIDAYLKKQDGKSIMSDKLILIVEDSATHMQIAEDLCTSNGYQVIKTDEGEKCIELAAEHQPDLILLDVILPKQNGYQVCRQLKKAPETKDIKIIMVTSKSQPSDKFWGMKQGADEYIFKPYEENEMLEAIQKHIGQEAV